MAQKQKKVETSAGQDPLRAMLGNRKSASATDGPAPPPLPGKTNKSSQVGDNAAPKSAKSKVNKPPPPVLKPSGTKKKNTKRPNAEKSSVTASPIAPEKTSKETLSKAPPVGEKDSSPKANSSVSLSEESATEASPRRVARRRPAGPVRGRIAANDDAPSIGGLIYALEQKPNTKPFRYAGYATIAWCIASLIFGYLILSHRMSEGVTLTGIAQEPLTFFILTTIVVPIAVIWFLALLAWRAEELRLRSSTMTEVAVRLAEPDRMAEQSVATLGQAVRRQVSFMNDAVTQALGRAGELEAMVHNEVTVLEQSYEENERKIRQLIQELSGERHALLNTSERVTTTLRELGNDVPNLIDKLSGQQIKLAQIIQGGGR